LLGGAWLGQRREQDCKSSSPNTRASSDEHPTASYSGINPNAFCGKRRRTHHEPGIFVDERRTDCDDTLQRDEGGFNETKVNSTCGTVEIGAGLTWDQVYDALEPTGVNVVGGRVPGVGVAGLTLGGGEYSRLPKIGSQAY
jgi:hypothetical protein